MNPVEKGMLVLGVVAVVLVTWSAILVAIADRTKPAEAPAYPAPCPACRGTGGGTWNDCPTCDGNGVV